MPKKISLFFILFLFFILITKTASYSTISEFDTKMLKDIATMEKRHFKNKDDTSDNYYRLKRLEETLLGESFEEAPLNNRMKRIKIASQKKMLQGASIPSSIGISRKRIQNDNIKIVDDNNVGILDGLMKLYAPNAYKIWQTKHETITNYEN